MSPTTHTKFRAVMTWTDYMGKGRVESSDHTQRRAAERALRTLLEPRFSAKGRIEWVRFRRRVVILELEKSYRGVTVKRRRDPPQGRSRNKRRAAPGPANARPSTNG